LFVTQGNNIRDFLSISYISEFALSSLQHEANSPFLKVYHYTGIHSQSALNTDTLKRQLHKEATFSDNDIHKTNSQ